MVAKTRRRARAQTEEPLVPVTSIVTPTTVSSRARNRAQPRTLQNPKNETRNSRPRTQVPRKKASSASRSKVSTSRNEPKRASRRRSAPPTTNPGDKEQSEDDEDSEAVEDMKISTRSRSKATLKKQSAMENEATNHFADNLLAEKRPRSKSQGRECKTETTKKPKLQIDNTVINMRNSDPALREGWMWKSRSRSRSRSSYRKPILTIQENEDLEVDEDEDEFEFEAGPVSHRTRSRSRCKSVPSVWTAPVVTRSRSKKPKAPQGVEVPSSVKEPAAAGSQLQNEIESSVEEPISESSKPEEMEEMLPKKGATGSTNAVVRVDFEVPLARANAHAQPEAGKTLEESLMDTYEVPKDIAAVPSAAIQIISKALADNTDPDNPDKTLAGVCFSVLRHTVNEAIDSILHKDQLPKSTLTKVRPALAAIAAASLSNISPAPTPTDQASEDLNFSLHLHVQDKKAGVEKLKSFMVFQFNQKEGRQLAAVLKGRFYK